MSEKKHTICHLGLNKHLHKVCGFSHFSSIMRTSGILPQVLMATSYLFILPTTAQLENYIFGPVEYPPLPTIGFKINHLSIIVSDLAASMRFNTTVLGMREIFTYHATSYFKISYLGHPSAGPNGTGYQPPLEMLRDKNNVQGLLELLYFAPNATNPPPRLPEASTKKTNTFSHIGLIVPDLNAARQRFLEHNVTILADVEDPAPDPAKVQAALNAYGAGLLPEGNDEVIQGMIQALTGSGQPAMMIEDPDGNVIEVQPQW
jgi:lactoylglutathione lyase